VEQQHAWHVKRLAHHPRDFGGRLTGNLRTFGSRKSCCEFYCKPENNSGMPMTKKKFKVSLLISESPKLE
jgi:hypothetical protein